VHEVRLLSLLVLSKQNQTKPNQGEVVDHLQQLMGNRYNPYIPLPGRPREAASRRRCTARRSGSSRRCPAGTGTRSRSRPLSSSLSARHPLCRTQL
jgi:hypothetical protein